MQSAVIIATVQNRAVVEAATWGAGSLSIPLRPVGGGSISHYGARADVTTGWSAPDFATVDLRDTDNPRAHFMEVIASMGLDLATIDTL